MKKILVIYGNDSALIRFRERQALDYFRQTFTDQLKIVPFTKDIPLEITQEPSLFGGDTEIFLFHGQDVSALDEKQMEALLSDDSGRVFMVLTSQKITTKTKLLAQLKNHPQAQLLKCYEITFQEFKRAVKTELEKYQMILDAECTSFLFARFANSMDALPKAIEKLHFWTSVSRETTLRDLDTLFVGNSPKEINAFASSFLMGQKDISLQRLTSLLDCGSDPITLVRSLMYHLVNLQNIRVRVDEGMSFSDAISAQRPPLLFTLRDLYNQSLKSWSLPKIRQNIQSLLSLERDLKLFPQSILSLFSEEITLL